MSIDYEDRGKTGNVQSIWWITLFNSNGDSFKIATSEFTDATGNYFYPIIKNKPSIRTSVNLAKSTAKTSDVTLICMNEYLPSKFLSEELVYGTYGYINQTVVIYSSFTDLYQDNPTSQVMIYTGRLMDVSHNYETCTLKIQSARPWDFISIPNTTTANGSYAPVVYGDYTHDTNLPPTPIEPSGTRLLFPLNFTQMDNGNLFHVAHQEIDGTSAGGGGGKGRLHIYNKTLDQFNVLYEKKNSSGSSSDYQDITVEEETGFHFCYTSNKMRRALLSYGSNIKSSTHSGSGSDKWSNSENMIDGDPATKGVGSTGPVTYGLGGGSPYDYPVKDEVVDLEVFESTNPFCNAEPVVEVKFDLFGRRVGDDGETWLQCHAYGKWFNIHHVNSIPTGSYAEIVAPTTFTVNLWTDTPVLGNDPTTNDSVVTVNDHEYQLPDDFRFRVYTIFHVATASGCHLQIAWGVYYSKFYLDLGFSASNKVVEHTGEDLYCGADGFPQSWSVNDLCTTLPEIHRDILYRFLGLTTTPDNYSSLNSDRANWTARYWLNEPKDLIKVLEELQYEGGFIFTYNASGVGKYIHINISGYTGGDIDWTFGDDDLAEINISHTPFSGLLTKMNIKYERHPAEKKYLSEVEESNSSSRTTWNIETDENIKQVKLNALTNATGVGEFYDYYDNIFGDIKIVVSGNIVNPVKLGVEVGDIVVFTDLTLKAYGTQLSATNYFMITDLTRSVDSLKFKAREVG